MRAPASEQLADAKPCLTSRSVEQRKALEAEGFGEAVGLIGSDAQREDTTPTVRRMPELEISKNDAR